MPKDSGCVGVSACAANADEQNKMTANFTDQLKIPAPHSLASSRLEMFRKIELLSVQALAVGRPRVAFR